MGCCYRTACENVMCDVLLHEPIGHFTINYMIHSKSNITINSNHMKNTINQVQEAIEKLEISPIVKIRAKALYERASNELEAEHELLDKIYEKLNRKYYRILEHFVLESAVIVKVKSVTTFADHTDEYYFVYMNDAEKPYLINKLSTTFDAAMIVYLSAKHLSETNLAEAFTTITLKTLGIDE